MRKLLILLSILSADVNATSTWDVHGELPADVQRQIYSKVSADLNREGSRDLLRNIIANNNPDVLSGCVTRTKTTCTGTGKDRVCTTDSWEVCVGSD